MKPANEFVHRFRTPSLSLRWKAITEIQRDARKGMVPNSEVKLLIDNMNAAAERRVEEAREGMVPVEDVRPLVKACGSPPWKQGATERVWNELDVLREKHPKLFTK